MRPFIQRVLERARAAMPEQILERTLQLLKANAERVQQIRPEDVVRLLAAWMEKARRVDNPYLTLLWILPIGGLLVVVLAFAGKVTPMTAGQYYHNESLGEITSSHTVGQTFYSPYPGLNRMDVMLANYGRDNSGTVTFNITPGPRDGRKLVSLAFDASDVRNNQLHTFEFPAMGDSGGKTLFFYFEAPGAAPGNAITAWSDYRNAYADGAAYLDGGPTEKDITFTAYYSPNVWQLADVYLDRLAKGKPGIWGNKAFYTATFTSYLALTGTLFFFLYRLALRIPSSQ